MCSCPQTKEIVTRPQQAAVGFANRAPGAAQSKSRSWCLKQALVFTFSHTMAAVIVQSSRNWLDKKKPEGKDHERNPHRSAPVGTQPGGTFPPAPQTPAGHWMCPKPHPHKIIGGLQLRTSRVSQQFFSCHLKQQGLPD